MGDSQHADDAGAVVACAWGLKPVAIDDWVQACLFRKYGIEMRGENDDRAGTLRGKLLGGEKSEDVADRVRLQMLEPRLGKARGEPLGASFFTEGRRGNCDEICLPIHDRFWIAVEPGESGMDRPLRGQRRDS